MTLSGIINCGAYTAVDQAETDCKRAEAVNATALSYLGALANKLKIRLFIFRPIMFSTANPAGLIVKRTPPIQSITMDRPSCVEKMHFFQRPTTARFSVHPGYTPNMVRTFVNTMLKIAATKPEIKVVFDQIGTPTYANDLAIAILKVIQNLAPGMPRLYHYSNEGVASWYDFAKAIFEIKALTNKVLPIRSDEFQTSARRPHYSVLDKTLIKKIFALDIPHWREGLKKCLTEA